MKKKCFNKYPSCIPMLKTNFKYNLIICSNIKVLLTCIVHVQNVVLFTVRLSYNVISSCIAFIVSAFGIFVLAPHPSMLHIFHGVLGQSTESFRSEPERNHQKINQIYLSVYLVDPFLFFFHADTFSFTLATLEGLRFFRHARLSFKYFQILQILFLNKLDHRARNIGHLDPPFGSKQHAQPFYTYIYNVAKRG